MDMTKCMTIPLNMHFKDLRTYNALLYTNILYRINTSTNARKMSGKI